MNDCIKVIIEADKGATVNSPNFFAIEEVIPPDSDIAAIEAGILDGSYTSLDLDLYTYLGKVKQDYCQAPLTTLDLVIETVTIDGTPTGSGTDTYKVVTFKIPPTVTSEWDNKEHTLLFDIKRTEIADTTEVDIWVKGTIQVNPVITE